MYARYRVGWWKSTARSRHTMVARKLLSRARNNSAAMEHGFQRCPRITTSNSADTSAQAPLVSPTRAPRRQRRNNPSRIPSKSATPAPNNIRNTDVTMRRVPDLLVILTDGTIGHAKIFDRGGNPTGGRHDADGKRVFPDPANDSGSLNKNSSDQNGQQGSG